MVRGINVIWVGLMVAGAVVTYAMKDSAGRAADRVHQLRADIAKEKETLNILRAEWGVLDQPARLQGLVARYSTYLQLKPLDVHQLASLDDVPQKPIPAPEAGLDQLRTGAIASAAPMKSSKPARPIQPTPRANPGVHP